MTFEKICILKSITVELTALFLLSLSLTHQSALYEGNYF